MRILDIRIRNIYPFKDANIKFTSSDEPAKVVLIIGENGTGKTTLLKSMLISAVARDINKISSRIGSDRAKGGEIRVKVAILDRIYHIQRLITGKKKGITRIEEYELINGEKANKRLLENNEEYFQLVPANYLEAVKSLSFYSVIESNLADAGKDLGGFIRDIIGATSFAKFLETLGSNIGAKRRELESKKRELNRLKVELSREIEERRRELERLNKTLQRARRHISEISTELERKEAEYKRLLEEKSRLEGEISGVEDIEKEYEELQRRLSRVSPRVAEIIKGIDLREAKEFLRFGGYSVIERMSSILSKAGVNTLEELMSLKPENLEDLEKKYNELSSELSRLKGEAKSVQSQLERLKRIIREYNSELEDLRASFNAIGCIDEERLEECVDQKIREKEREREDAKAKSQRVLGCIRMIFGSPGSYRCPICGREISDSEMNEVINRLEEERKELVEKIGSILRDIENHLERLREIRSKVAEYRRISEEFKRVRSEYLELDKVSFQLQKRIKELEKELAEVERELRKAKEIDYLIRQAESIKDRRLRINEALERLGEKAKEIEKYGSIIANLDIDVDIQEALKRLEELSKKLSEIKEKKANYERLVRKLSQIEKEIEKLKEEKNGLERKIGLLEGKIENIKKEIEERERKILELNKRILKYDRAIRTLTELERELSRRSPNSILSKFEAGVMNRSIKSINRELKKIIEQINEGSGIKRKEIRVESVKDRVVIKARRYEDPEDMAREIKNLSAGERMLVSIIFMLAFRKALGLDSLPLILDEPTANADENTRFKVLELVKEFLSKKIVPQVFIATHDEELREKLGNMEGVKVIKLEKNGAYTEVKDLSPR